MSVKERSLVGASIIPTIKAMTDIKPITIALVNEKGGVGKTFLTATLATMLTQLGYDVASIDMDPQGHLGILLGYLRDTIDFSIYHLMLNYSAKELRELQPVFKAILPTYYDNSPSATFFDPRTPSVEQFEQAVREVTQEQETFESWQTLKQAIEDEKQAHPYDAPHTLFQRATDGKYTLEQWNDLDHRITEHAQAQLEERIENAFRGPDLIPITADASNADHTIRAKHDYWTEQLRNVLLPLIKARKHAYILIDLPPSMGVLTKNALGIADYVAIPVVPERLPTEGLLSVLGLIEQVQERANPDLKIAGAILNKIQPWAAHQEMAIEIRNFSDELHVFTTEMKQTAAFENALRTKTMAVLSQPNSTAARTCWLLLDELLQIIGGPAQAQVAEIAANIIAEEKQKQEKLQTGQTRKAVAKQK